MNIVNTNSIAPSTIPNASKLDGPTMVGKKNILFFHQDKEGTHKFLNILRNGRGYYNMAMST